jgi:hypothetical protein
MTGSREWSEQWPVAGTAPTDVDSARARPIAVEVVLDLEDWGQIRRVVEVPG